MPKTVVVDCRGHMLGRLASVLAKQLLSGQQIVAVRTEEIVISGGMVRQKAKYERFLNKRNVSNPRRGAVKFRAPSRILWRTVRGMVPHKTARGAAALDRLKAFEGVPHPYDKVKRLVIPDALKVLRLQHGHRNCKLGDLASSIGWKHQEAVEGLEAKRKAKAVAFYEAKKKLAALRAKAAAQVDGAYVALWIALSAGGFPYPVALTLWHMVFCAGLAVGLVKGGYVEPVNMSAETYLKTIAPIGFLYSGTLWLGNAAYLYLSVSFIQMLKARRGLQLRGARARRPGGARPLRSGGAACCGAAGARLGPACWPCVAVLPACFVGALRLLVCAMMPVAVFCVGCGFGTEKYHTGTLLNMVVISVGVGIASYGELNFVLIGVLLQLLSIGTESTRLTLVQILLQRRGLKLNPITTLYYIAPCCGAFLLVPFAFLELPRILNDPAVVINPWVFLSNATVAFGLNMAVFLLIGKTSALTMNIAGVAKDWLLILLSYLMYKAPVTAINLIGYGIAFAAVCYYNYVKLQSMKAAAKPEAKASAPAPPDGARAEAGAAGAPRARRCCPAPR
eukprot:scaffold5.g804.t1